MHGTLDHPVDRYWTPLPDGAIRCDLCPNRCRLTEGKRGICYVRRNVGGCLALTCYGRVSGLSADPIEKKPLYHFLPGTTSLSFGVIGCNLSCGFCQNAHISKPRDDSALSEFIDPADIAGAAVRHGCDSVSFTYNEPIVSFEYTLDVARACRERGIRTVAVTAGYIEPEPRREFFALMDAANVDLKAFTEEFYRRHCGAHLQPVLDTLRYIRHETRTWLEVTTLLIPGENDAPEEIDRLCDWIVSELGPSVPLHFSAFHPMYKFSDRPPTSPSTLFRARQQALGKGIAFVYTGNIRDDGGSATACPSCGSLLVRRTGFRVDRNLIGADGRCPSCGAALPGVWEGGAGAPR